MTAKKLLKKQQDRVSLNIKITAELDKRLKRARRVAREKGQQFNVSNAVELYLEKELKKVEKMLEITQSIKEEEAQQNLFDEKVEENEEKRVENSWNRNY